VVCFFFNFFLSKISFLSLNEEREEMASKYSSQTVEMVGVITQSISKLFGNANVLRVFFELHKAKNDDII